MKRSTLLHGLKNTAIAFALAAVSAFIVIPADVQAAENDTTLVLAYAEQEGMGYIRSYQNEVLFKDSTEAKIGDVIRLSAAYYPKCTFDGWYVNGKLKTTNKDCSVTIDGKEPMLILSAKYSQNGEHLKGRAELDISKTTWGNRVCRFAPDSTVKDVAVTTAMVVQGEQCLAAFNTVKEDFTLARTYNITFTKYYNKNLETLAAPADLVFQIPTELQAPGRVFRMINVYKGQPTVCEDKDASETTLTFSTDKAGAYALVYRDTPATMPPEGVEIDPEMMVVPENLDPAQLAVIAATPAQ